MNVYLKASPSFLISRIQNRNQTGDDKITEEDLELLNQIHEQYISKKQDSLITINIEDFKTSDDIVNMIFQKLTPFIVKNIERR